MRSLENAIEVTHMSKTFKRVFDKPNTLKERLVFWNKSKPELFHVLNDINIDIKKGETVALIGTNGSG
ncbi:MAG: ABC transporter ATP-binding protein, partial [Bacilli bacterium]